MRSPTRPRSRQQQSGATAPATCPARSRTRSPPPELVTRSARRSPPARTPHTRSGQRSRGGSARARSRYRLPTGRQQHHASAPAQWVGRGRGQDPQFPPEHLPTPAAGSWVPTRRRFVGHGGSCRVQPCQSSSRADRMRCSASTPRPSCPVVANSTRRETSAEARSGPVRTSRASLSNRVRVDKTHAASRNVLSGSAAISHLEAAQQAPCGPLTPEIAPASPHP